MSAKKKFPVGVEDFTELISEDCYYVDKTLLIRELLGSLGRANLFARPRRFGKTLSLSMIKAFFEAGSDPSLFDGLAISRERDLCERHQAKYPVILLPMKAVGGETYGTALGMLAFEVSKECDRLSFLMESGRVTRAQKELLRELRGQKASEDALRSSLSALMQMLRAHFGQKAILLIDDYDAPLERAKENGYCQKMADFMRAFLGDAVKTSPDLYFAVAAGCLSITGDGASPCADGRDADPQADPRMTASAQDADDPKFGTGFGFTDADVKKMLDHYGLSYAYGDVKKWYGGYRLGGADACCPKDVVSHCDRLLQIPNAEPDFYKDGGNSRLFQLLVGLATPAERRDVERLLAGESLEKRIEESLPLGDLGKRELIWSLLWQAGYLSLDGGSKSARHKAGDGRPISQPMTARLSIPNRKVMETLVDCIDAWFEETHLSQGAAGLYDELWSGNERAIRARLCDILGETICYQAYRDNYYHSVLTSILLEGPCPVHSSYEPRKKRSDIVVDDARHRRVAIIDTRRSSCRESMDGDADAALRQIEERRYSWPYRSAVLCGISFFEKDCRVKIRMEG